MNPIPRLNPEPNQFLQFIWWICFSVPVMSFVIFAWSMLTLTLNGKMMESTFSMIAVMAIGLGGALCLAFRMPEEMVARVLSLEGEHVGRNEAMRRLNAPRILTGLAGACAGLMFFVPLGMILLLWTAIFFLAEALLMANAVNAPS